MKFLLKKLTNRNILLKIFIIIASVLLVITSLGPTIMVALQLK